MTKLTKFYSDNFGKNVTKTIVGSMITAIIALGGFIIFRSIPEKVEIEKEFTALSEIVQNERIFLSKQSAHYEAGEEIYENFRKRRTFIIKLSEDYNSKELYKLDSNQIDSIKNFSRQNLSDLGLNSAIIANYKSDEDIQFKETLEFEKQIFQFLNNSPIVNEKVNNLFNDYIVSSQSFAEFIMMHAINIRKEMIIKKSDVKNDEKFQQILKKFRFNNILFFISSLLIILFTFIIGRVLIIGIEIGHFKE